MPVQFATKIKENGKNRRNKGEQNDVPDTRLHTLLQQCGNRAIQRALTMPRPNEPFELDKLSEKRIDEERGKGIPLDEKLQAELGQSMGYDLSQVRIHPSPEANDRNQQLNAKAFTSGTDIYFRDNFYDPENSAGKHLLTHELTHVIQQGTGQVQSGGSGMTVTAPGDSFEKAADQSAEAQAASSQSLQTQEEDEEDETIQKQEVPEEEELL